MNPLIVNIKRNSLDDGPGIRTVIFFKGCPLSCVWCQNPETKSAAQELSFVKENCNECEKCMQACEQEAISKKLVIERLKCNLCGACIETCPTGALNFVGKEYSVEELLETILKDKVFFENSGGGITLTGGEPTFHMAFLNALLMKVREHGIHACLETCGYYNRDKFNELILPYVDLIYFDIKIFDSETHQKYCGVPNEIILSNLRNLLKHQEVSVLPRIPLIPKITATRQNLQAISNFLNSLGIEELGLLPYNPMWLQKVETIGASLDYNRNRWLTDKEKKSIKNIFRNFKFRDF